MLKNARELAIRDPLTGLLNRRSFIEHLEHAITYATRHNDRIAVLFMDLDKFKNINDTLGHEAGDELLREVAARLIDAVREADHGGPPGRRWVSSCWRDSLPPTTPTAWRKRSALALSNEYDLGEHNVPHLGQHEI